MMKYFIILLITSFLMVSCQIGDETQFMTEEEYQQWLAEHGSNPVTDKDTETSDKDSVTAPDNETEDLDTTIETDEDTETPDEDIPVEKTPDISGIWAQLQIQHTITKVTSIITTTQNTLTNRLMIRRIEQNGESLKIATEMCYVEVQTEDNPDQGVTFEPGYWANATVFEEDSTISKVDGNWLFHQPVRWEFHGMKDMVPGDAMPKDKNDSRVYDEDEDGNIGVTFHNTIILSGDMYVVQRGSFELTSTTLTENHIDGNLKWTEEQIVLDASSSVLKAARTSYMNPASGKESVFYSTKLDHDVDCQYIIDNQNTLFQR